MHKIYALKYLRYEKFDAILRASRPRHPDKSFAIFNSYFPPNVRPSMRVGFIQSPMLSNPARFLAVAGGATPPPTYFYLEEKRV